MSDGNPLLDTEAVAAKIGVTSETVRMYLKRTRKRIADGLTVRPQDLPLPDEQFNRSPAWLQSTIDAWIANRPGRGRRPSSS
ncbi:MULTISPECIES: MarR family transcriptional regulator [Streptomyces]|uniref:MarR family transcriptional regulator n=1 Tax=Streptomyces muensis TaxID=1077944 RepID=A0A9X1TIQ4_STRM4|nr:MULTISPECIES: MarR family transcriptional regulator [Streptomyces]MCF1592497.1 MarR family transcriptional regulator [Streptomyces muensis]QKV98308.1 MarR family transcriptional regulator [Streptomyces sp. NA02950]